VFSACIRATHPQLIPLRDTLGVGHDQRDFRLDAVDDSVGRDCVRNEHRRDAGLEGGDSLAISRVSVLHRKQTFFKVPNTGLSKNVVPSLLGAQAPTMFVPYF